jgi:hypothetical protein
LFEDSEKKFQDSLSVIRQRPRAARQARSLAARNRLTEALTPPRRLLANPRDAEIHHTVGSIYERMRRREAARLSSYINLLRTGSQREGAWARAEAFCARSARRRYIDPARPRLHIPFRVSTVIVKAGQQGTAAGLRARHRVEQTVISRETAARMGIRPIVNILSAGGDLGVRELS